MSIYFSDDKVSVHAGDCRIVMQTLPECSVDAVVCDPPYELTRRAQAGGFMGKSWDATGVAFDPTTWDRVLRLLKPGGHLLAFGGTRTWHRLAVAVEDAGFEIRDSIAWLHGSGFPKSRDVAKAIDAAAGAERQIVGTTSAGSTSLQRMSRVSHGYRAAPTDVTPGEIPVTVPATTEAARWEGWGTALKPAFEPVLVARKPLIGTIAANVQEHGVGGININACRVSSGCASQSGRADEPSSSRRYSKQGAVNLAATPGPRGGSCLGRWPANAVIDPDQSVLLDGQSGPLISGANPTVRGSDKFRNAYGDFKGQQTSSPGRGTDVGGASRFVTVADWTEGDRAAVDQLSARFRYNPKAGRSERPEQNGVQHPTVKPLELMRWLVRLVTPPRGLLLDPFGGSGTTAEAALLEGFRCTIIEQDAAYLPLIVQRIRRRRDPVAYLADRGEDLGLFDEQPS